MNLPTLNALGVTRTRVTENHALIAPDGHVQTRLPGWHGARCTVLISPQLGAKFTQYLVHMEAGAKGTPTPYERFIVVLSGTAILTGEVRVAAGRTLREGDYAFLPAASGLTLEADAAATLCVFERPYLPLGGAPPPEPIFGNLRTAPGEAFLGDEAVTVRPLLPEHASYDLMMSTMTFAPGASLPFAETHVMEHGLLMLTGGGLYKLAESWYPVTAGDVIYMAPYCPQWFAALGKTEATYLLYKDSYRDPAALAKL